MGKRLHNVFACAAYLGLHLLVLRMLQHTIDERHDLTHVRLAHAASRHDGTTDPDPACHSRRFLIVGNGILVDDNSGGVQGGIGLFAGDAFVGQIHQHQVSIGASRHDFITALDESLREGARVGDHLLLVPFERRRKRFLEGHRFGRNHMHEGTALQSGENDFVDGLGMFGLAHGDATARTAKGLMGRGGHEVRIGDGIRDVGLPQSVRQYARCRPADRLRPTWRSLGT